MDYNKILDFALDSMLKAGAEKAKGEVVVTEKHELNTESNKVKLFRTNENKSLMLKYIADQRQGTITLNKVDEDSIIKGIEELVQITAASPQDEAYDIAPEDEGSYEMGALEPDLDKVFDQLSFFMDEMKTRYSKISGDAILSYDLKKRYVKNTNGLNISEYNGAYNFMMMFAAKEGDKITSFNYSGASMAELDQKLSDAALMGQLMDQTVEELNAVPLNDKFVGDVIITPHCLTDLLSTYSGIALTDGSLIAGTSVLKDKVNQVVASPLLTWTSTPRSSNVGQIISSEGYVMKDMPIIENGVLKNLMLSDYAARKTGLTRSDSYGHPMFSVEPGDRSYKDLIKDVDKGILLCRFSGGHPNADGNFAGVAKNSFYIENGEIKHPIVETMVSGNIFNIFKDIKSISNERVEFGHQKLPWVHTTNATISG